MRAATVSLHVRLPVELRQAIDDAARDAGVTVTELVTRTLADRARLADVLDAAREVTTAPNRAAVQAARGRLADALDELEGDR